VEGAGGDGEEGGGAEWYTNTAPNGTQKFISPPLPHLDLHAWSSEWEGP